MTSEASTLITVPMCGVGQGTIRLVDEAICARILDGVHFDFDYTFIRPEAKAIIREIVDDINEDAERRVLITGHTDRVGSNAYNETLSDSRARSVYGYITNQPDVWMDLLRTMLPLNGGPREKRSGTGQSRDRWQTREIQYMLHYMRRPDTGDRYYNGAIDNVFGPDTQTALDDFRTDNGLPAGGVPGSPRHAGVDEDTWRAMFARYIELDALHIEPDRFLDPALLGCGENFPRLETRPPGTESQDKKDAEARLEINRRVEFLLIPPALVPENVTCEAFYENGNSPIIVCPGDPQPISVTLHCTKGSNPEPMAGLELKVTGVGGFSRQFTTDAQGKVVLPDGDTVQGDYRVEVIGNFGLVLRDNRYGEVRGAEILLRLTESATVEIMVTPVATRLNFVENVEPFTETLNTLDNPLDNPLETNPVEFRLAADLENAIDETITVLLSSFLIREAVSPVPGDDDDSGVVTPPTPLEFIGGSDVPLPQIALNQRFKLRLEDEDIVGDTVTVTLSSHWIRD